MLFLVVLRGFLELLFLLLRLLFLLFLPPLFLEDLLFFLRESQLDEEELELEELEELDELLEEEDELELELELDELLDEELDLLSTAFSASTAAPISAKIYSISRLASTTSMA